MAPFFFDFSYLEARLAIELDGDQHAEDARRRHDQKRPAFRSRQMNKAPRFWTQDVLLSPNGFLEAILTAIEGQDGQSPVLPPAKLAKGEGPLTRLPAPSPRCRGARE
ncbi:MAG: DUF559 domain-containing protein [Acidobacteria bacterium]|nr:DUF559 domain-containing protein [Acidobacteriota bacterium]MCG3192268.1 hypothetical protein [Thermoanaerobaculia bacterium]MCK6682546.1 DUF559 domain-containing protein [Thermoanaerobaculia bacterium]